MTGASEIHSHLVRMRSSCLIALAAVAIAVVLSFTLPHRGAALASPELITLAAVAASLWIGFTANRDARDRLQRIRSSFSAHGDEARLLRDHWLVYLLVLLRLEVMVACGVVVSLRGLGAAFGVWIVLLAGLLIALTWPTVRKTQLLLGRARALREID